MKRIVIGTDLSPASENAVVFACHLARLLGANLEVVYVMDSIFESSKASPSSFISSYRNTMKEELEGFIQRISQTKGIECVPESEVLNEENAADVVQPRMRARLAFGFPEQVLVDLSERADLLVLATTGRGGLVRKLFGSVSIEVSKKAHSPVLLVPPQAIYRGFRNLLYASDFESAEPEAVAEAVAFAQRLGGNVHFVHVGLPAEEDVERLEERLKELYREASDASHPFIFSRVIREDVVEALHEYAFDHRIDLYIFVTHQRSFWEELLHRSITREMLLHTSTPVLVIHADKADA
ncbi:MAG: universal stress protein [Saprospiraceae bacterium]|nr:universal stress protein [Saprospiraceae bacterium]MDW8482958.1 universal stress protein [Saprospiraceae bacterium]